MKALPPTYNELLIENKKLKAELESKNNWINQLIKHIGILANFQPPAPIILQVTPEQAEQAKRIIASAADGVEGAE